MVEGDRPLTRLEEAVVQDVEHLEERGVLVDLDVLVALELALGPGVGLAPDVERHLPCAILTCRSWSQARSPRTPASPAASRALHPRPSTPRPARSHAGRRFAWPHPRPSGAPRGGGSHKTPPGRARRGT